MLIGLGDFQRPYLHEAMPVEAIFRDAIATVAVLDHFPLPSHSLTTVLALAATGMTTSNTATIRTTAAGAKTTVAATAAPATTTTTTTAGTTNIQLVTSDTRCWFGADSPPLNTRGDIMASWLRQGSMVE